VEDVGLMTAQISKASKEQTNATRSIFSAIDTIKNNTHGMDDLTRRQAEDGAKIKVSVNGFAEMITAYFNDLEERKELSEAVMSELEVLKEKST
jgi:hypothetical protein